MRRGDELDITIVAYTMKNVQFFSLPSRSYDFDDTLDSRGAGILSAGRDGSRDIHTILRGNDFACGKLFARRYKTADIKLFLSLIAESERPNSRNIDCEVLLRVVTLKALLTVLALRVHVNVLPSCFLYPFRYIDICYFYIDD